MNIREDEIWMAQEAVDGLNVHLSLYNKGLSLIVLNTQACSDKPNTLQKMLCLK